MKYVSERGHFFYCFFHEEILKEERLLSDLCEWFTSAQTRKRDEKNTKRERSTKKQNKGWKRKSTKKINLR